MSEFSILIEPYLSEKGLNLKEASNKVIFKVAPSANKTEIKKAINKIFNVEVINVQTINCPGKQKRRGNTVGQRPGWKKAIITLKKGDSIEYFEGT